MTDEQPRRRGIAHRYTFTSGDGTNGTVDISNFERAYLGGVREDIKRVQAEQDAARYRLDGTIRVR